MHRGYVFFIGLIFIGLALSACGPGQWFEPKLTPTPTPIPLTSEEHTYFDAVFALRDKYDKRFVTWEGLEEALRILHPPEALKETHIRILSPLSEANSAQDMFNEWIRIYMLEYCQIGSIDYVSCSQRQDDAFAHAEDSEEKRNAARAQFRTQWVEAQRMWDDYLAAHGAPPVPTPTRFPIPPLVTSVPRGTVGVGVFGTEITVVTVNTDAWTALKGISSSVKPAQAGNKYILVKVTVTNRGGDVIYAGADEFSIYADGKIFAESAQTNPDDDFKAKELRPGESTGGSLSFEVPAELADPLLLFLEGDVVLGLQ